MADGGVTDRIVRPEVAALRERPVAQVLIIGGGINGLGTFRDLALQGVDVVLVERGDFGSGASSASSHMIHGGVRYLENGEFRLVKEAVHERNSLLRIAPHYVKPLQTTIPIFSTFSGILAAPARFLTHRQRAPKERGALLIRLGLALYDSFSRDGGTLPRHVFRNRKAALRDLPRLNRAVKYTASYFDASVHEPERLALDVLRDGLAADGDARAANYVEAVGAHDGAVRVRDTLSGAEFDVRADVVVNASGPWTDLTNAALGQETRYMGGTKGSHIVLDQPELLAACAGRELFFENSDGRIVLIYPLRGRVMVGTTDLEADIREPVRCTPEEVDYFIDLIGHVFPDIPVGPDDIVYRFAGIRPLPSHEHTQPGFVSRDYRIVATTPAGLQGRTLLSLVGGKLTTFRAAAGRLTDRVLALLRTTRRIDIDELPIGGGRDYPSTDAARADWVAAHAAEVGAARTERLLDRYGTRAAEVVDFLRRHADGPVPGTDRVTTGELAYMVREERVAHLDDVLLRRTNCGFDGAVTAELVQGVATVLAPLLHWTQQDTADEISRTRRILREQHGVVLEPAPLASAPC